MERATVIFDMDGLLIDSEPLWKIAAQKIFKNIGIELTNEQYLSSTGLRTKEFVQLWCSKFGKSEVNYAEVEENITDLVMQLVDSQGILMNGVQHILPFFKQRKFKIGIASSSPEKLIKQVITQFSLHDFIDEIASAEHLAYGKPHPEVYINCAKQLGVAPKDCIAFEDSFNGLLAAKAARMKCVIVPEYAIAKDKRWGAADLQLSSLQNFNALHLGLL